jgi:putative spermidine/putrescine transport system permease protein
LTNDAPLPVPHSHRLWLYTTGALVLLFLVVPSIIIVLMSFSGSSVLTFPPKDWSFRWYEVYFNSQEWRDATLVSFKVAVLTALLATPIGTAAAYTINDEAIWFRGSIYSLLTMAMIIPVILVSIGVFFLYAKLGLNNSILGLVIAHTVLALPLVIIAVLSGLRTYDMNQEKVARSLGANRFSAFLQVTAPQIKLSILSGALFAFVTSFDEVVVALFISGGDTATLTRRMFSALRDEIDPTIAAISTLLIILSIVVLTTLQMLGNKSHR